MSDKIQYETLIKEVREISSDIARLDADLTQDRRELADFRVQMATLVEEVNQLRKEMAAITGDVGDRVKDTLRPAVKEVTALKDEIKKRRSIVITRKGILSWVKSCIKKGGEKNGT